MKVAGFSFIRNALQYDYPIVEAITSVLPLCDEFVIAVGQSDDETLALIKAIPSDKIRIISSVWDDTAREGGRVLALETDKALAAVSADADWAFYIQGDEVLHEQYIPAVRQALEAYKEDVSVDGLLFNYLHFYGAYEYVGDSRRWYRHEIRVIRPRIGVYAYRDAQGFRKGRNQKLRVQPVDAYIYHYGWVKSLEHQKRKFGYFYRFWFSDEHMKTVEQEASQFDYSQHIDSLALFSGTHPAVMANRIAHANLDFRFDTSRKQYSPKVRFLMFIERLTGWRIGEYRNYKLRRD